MPQRRRVFLPGLALLAALVTLGTGCTSMNLSKPREQLVREVTAAEIAFATTMARRDFDGFLRFVADDAVFLNDGKPLRGKAAIGEHWKRFYAGPTAPFAWKPERVEVTGSGTLAQTTGPVSLPDGKVVARFYSTWRLEGDGSWKVVLDDGYDVCDCGAKR